jgi:hypothetical protein
MRVIFGLAVAGLVAASVSSARAEEWCGFLDKAGARVQCGFSSLAECKQALGDQKNGYCIPDPTSASIGNRAHVRLAASRF